MMSASMREILSMLHVAGGMFAFAVALVALLATKGDRMHVLAGRGFVLGIALAAIPGVSLTLTGKAIDRGLLMFGLLALFFASTGYLAPRIARGWRAGYVVDRWLTVAGALVSLALLVDGLRGSALAMKSDVTFGALGLWVAWRHWTWRLPAHASRWRVEHFTSMLAACTVAWSFVLAQFVPAFPFAAHFLLPVAGVGAITLAQRRFGKGVSPAPPAE
jgi:hypothetical protein